MRRIKTAIALFILRRTRWRFVESKTNDSRFWGIAYAPSPSVFDPACLCEAAGHIYFGSKHYRFIKQFPLDHPPQP